jgi:hypothetical protein
MDVEVMLVYTHACRVLLCYIAVSLHAALILFLLLTCNRLLPPACSLHLEDVMALLQIEAPALLNGLLQRQDDITALNSSGWQTVTSGRRPGAEARDALQHWVQGDPVSDWHFKQQLLHAQQQEAERQRMQEEGLLDEQGNPWFGSDFGFSTFQSAGKSPGWCMPMLLLRLTGGGRLRNRETRTPPACLGYYLPHPTPY